MLLALAGCVSAGTPDAGKATGFPAATDQLVTAWCEGLKRCGALFSDGVNDCRAIVLADLGASQSPAPAIEVQGDLEGCAAALGADPCARVERFLPENFVTRLNRRCNLRFMPSAANGQACTIATRLRQCKQGGSICLAEPGASPCNGLCQPDPAGTIGAPCLANGSCNDGARCDTTTATCVRLPRVGEACSPAVPWCYRGGCNGSVCIAWAAVGDFCGAPGVACEPGVAACSPTTCAALPGPGSACSPQGTCRAGALCDQGACVASLGVGDPCQNSSLCGLGLSCDRVLRSCRGFVSGQPGTACSEHADCFSDHPGFRSICRNSKIDPAGGVGTQGLCGAPQLGDACFSSFECPEATECVGGRCQAATQGSSCTSTYSCQLSDRCPAGTCIPGIQPGVVCSGAEGECAGSTAACARDSSSQLVCVSVADVGAPCASDEGCKALLACRSSMCSRDIGHVGLACVGGVGGSCITGVCNAVGVCAARGPQQCR